MRWGQSASSLFTRQRHPREPLCLLLSHSTVLYSIHCRNPNVDPPSGGKEAGGGGQQHRMSDRVLWPAFEEKQQQYLSLCKSCPLHPHTHSPPSKA